MSITHQPTAADNPPTLQTRPRRPLWQFAVIGLVVLAAVAGGAALWLQNRLDPGTAVAGVTEVAVNDNEFLPAAIKVPVGTTVTWGWDGEELHNVVGDGMESPTQSDGTFARQFDTTGTYGYRCTLHFLMRGEVVVTD